MNFPGKKVLSVFKHSNNYHSAKNHKKITSISEFNAELLMDWLTDRQTDRQTDREQWYYRTLHRAGVQKIKFGTECDYHWGGNNNFKLNLFIRAMVHRSNVHYSKINQKRNWKQYIKFILELQKNETSQTTNSALHLEGWARYFRHRYSIKLYVIN